MVKYRLVCESCGKEYSTLAANWHGTPYGEPLKCTAHVDYTEKYGHLGYVGVCDGMLRVERIVRIPFDVTRGMLDELPKEYNA